MRKSVIVYIIYTFIALLYGIITNYTLKGLEVQNYSFNIELWMLALLVLVATSLSFWAVLKFSDCKTTIRVEAEKVETDEVFIKKIDKRFQTLSCNILKVAIIILGFFSGYAVVNNASLNWEKETKMYAVLLVSALIIFTFYGYIYFMVIIICMRDVYNSDFKKYTFIYPIATGIFEKYTRICSFGLILFWIIGFILILLSVIVFNTDAFFIMAVIGTLIFVGYLIFTFYPYYLTRKTIAMLKMQTIREICKKNNMLVREVFDNNADIIKFISESPDIVSSNFHLILTSTLAAIASLVTPFLSFFK